ncbi:MAG: hypothetical protein J1E64_10555, partial [Acetatifactor sp.]|nr:hypothetical protein [Acetatifactor sp.]
MSDAEIPIIVGVHCNTVVAFVTNYLAAYFILVRRMYMQRIRKTLRSFMITIMVVSCIVFMMPAEFMVEAGNTTTETCTKCSGDGKCTVCNGTGKKTVTYSTGRTSSIR